MLPVRRDSDFAPVEASGWERKEGKRGPAREEDGNRRDPLRALPRPGEQPEERIPESDLREDDDEVPVGLFVAARREKNSQQHERNPAPHGVQKELSERLASVAAIRDRE